MDERSEKEGAEDENETKITCWRRKEGKRNPRARNGAPTGLVVPAAAGLRFWLAPRGVGSGGSLQESGWGENTHTHTHKKILRRGVAFALGFFGGMICGIGNNVQLGWRRDIFMRHFPNNVCRHRLSPQLLFLPSFLFFHDAARRSPLPPRPPRSRRGGLPQGRVPVRPRPGRRGSHPHIPLPRH